MNHRALILTAALMAGPNEAQSGDIEGSLVFQAGAAIPAGRIELSLRNNAPPDIQITSDGTARQIAFTLTGPLPARIVARLERPDGWLLARGSATLEPGKPVEVTLHPVLY